MYVLGQKLFNVCGLACIPGLTGSNNQVYLTTTERSSRWNGALGYIRHQETVPVHCRPSSRPTRLVGKNILQGLGKSIISKSGQFLKLGNPPDPCDEE